MSDKNKPALEKPRMCEVLEVLPGEQWRVQNDDAIYRVNPGGMLEYRMPADDEWRLSDVIHLTAVINQPGLIIRGPVWTEEEAVLLQAFRKVGVNWLSRDPGSDVVDMWTEMPESDAGGYKGIMIGSVPMALFPSLLDDQLVNVSGT